METRVRKWGNSLGLRLPKAVAEEARLANGSSVDIRVKNGAVVVRARRGPRPKLADLLRRVRPSNLHREFDSGRARGRELW